jgi:hypothetical protein
MPRKDLEELVTMLLSERSQSEKNTHCVSLVFWKRQNLLWKQVSGC